MYRSRPLVALLACSLVAAPATAFVPGPVYSLDDNPSAPLTSPLGVFPGYGAEDPFGLFFGAPPAGLAPSPTLGLLGVPDSALLEPSGAGVPAIDSAPFIDAGTGASYGYLDAVSNNTALFEDGTVGVSPGAKYNILFSVDRRSVGVAGDVPTEAALGEQPADLFISSEEFPSPASLVGTLPALSGFIGAPPVGPGSNQILFDEDTDLDLAVGLGPFEPEADNIDAVDLRNMDTSGDLVPDLPAYHSINPDDAFLQSVAFGPGAYHSPADIFYVPAGSGVSFPYADESAIFGPLTTPFVPTPGIAGETDDIDALVVWDVDTEGVLEPGRDHALFSLSPGSALLSLLSLIAPVDAATIFFTDFTGSFTVYAESITLGLNPGLPFESDNVDAAELVLSADANLDGTVDLLDFDIMAMNFGLVGGGWHKADWNADGVVDLLDFARLAMNFGSTSPATVPEPTTLGVFALAGLAASRRRRA